MAAANSTSSTTVDDTLPPELELTTLALRARRPLASFGP